MPRPAHKQTKVRLNLLVSEQIREKLEKVRLLSEADSFTEVIRRALTIYEALLTVTIEEHGRILLQAPRTPIRELLIR